MHHLHAKVRNLLGKGTVSFPGKDKDGEKE